MPLDPHIADFLAASSGAPQPASLAEMRAATEADLLRLQGEAELRDDMQDYVVIADDGYAIALRVYTPAASNTEMAQPAMLFAHGGGWCLGSLTLYDRPCRHWRMPPVGKYSRWITGWHQSIPSRDR
mgnify:CR=1 FL=1